MDIGGVIIRTPHDDDMGVEIDPDWRRKVAVAWVDNNRWFPPKHIYDDPYIKRYREYIRAVRQIGDHRLPERFKELRTAESWYTGGDRGIKGILEPLLLTDLAYKHIAEDILPAATRSRNKSEDSAIVAGEKAARTISIYNKLFFNIRDDAGWVSESIHMRTVFALRGLTLNTTLPDSYLPRVIGAFYGYPSLMYLIHNAKYAHGDMKGGGDQMRHAIALSVQAHLMTHVIKNDMNNFDSIALLGKNTEYEKMLYETKAHERDHNQYRDSWEALMDMRKPKLVQAAITVEERMKIDDGNMAMFRAKKNIAEHGEVKDSGTEGQAKAWLANRNAHFEDTGAAQFINK